MIKFEYCRPINAKAVPTGAHRIQSLAVFHRAKVQVREEQLPGNTC